MSSRHGYARSRHSLSRIARHIPSDRHPVGDRPGIALGIAIPLLWGHAVTPLDITLAVVLYVVAGHGITVGDHRLLTQSNVDWPDRARLAVSTAP
jgi:hypothetical protein